MRRGVAGRGSGGNGLLRYSHYSDRLSRGLVTAVSATSLFLGPLASAQVDTTLRDFFAGGTQPDESDGLDYLPIRPSDDDCIYCHELSDPLEVPIYTRWSSSMMANAARDPLFHAGVAIANQDAAFGGDLCLRCHTPGGWLAGRSIPTDGSKLTDDGGTYRTC